MGIIILFLGSIAFVSWIIVTLCIYWIFQGSTPGFEGLIENVIRYSGLIMFGLLGSWSTYGLFKVFK